MKWLVVCLWMVASPVHDIRINQIYECKYGTDLAFLEFTGLEWQCIPCFAAMNDDEVDFCKQLKEKHK